MNAVRGHSERPSSPHHKILHHCT